MKSLDCRLVKLESAAGLLGDPLTHASDAELDEMMVRAYADGEALGMDQTEFMFFNEATTEPVLSVHRQFWPMSTDIEALELKRAGRVFYDECADLSVEQICVRVKAHIARLEERNGRPAGMSENRQKTGKRGGLRPGQDLLEHRKLR